MSIRCSFIKWALIYTSDASCLFYASKIHLRDSKGFPNSFIAIQFLLRGRSTARSHTSCVQDARLRFAKRHTFQSMEDAKVGNTRHSLLF